MKLFFRNYGEKGNQPLIILHGLFGVSDNWATYGRRIAAEGFNVFIPDLRNHGRSFHSDVFNYPALTEDLYEFIEENEIENPIIMGHSMGGKVAMSYTLENPDSVKKLAVIDITLKSYGPRDSHKRIIRAMKNIDLKNVKSRREAEEKLSEYIKEERIKLFVLKNLKRNKDGSFEWIINLKAIENNLDEMFDNIESDKVYERPTLFVRGGNSDYILPEDYKIIRKHFPNAEIVTIENASHWVHAEQPELFYQITYGFFIGSPSWYEKV